jgi:hypothetical protein
LIGYDLSEKIQECFDRSQHEREVPFFRFVSVRPFGKLKVGSEPCRKANGTLHLELSNSFRPETYMDGCHAREPEEEKLARARV